MCQLRDIATYIELIHKKSSIVKAASSGTGAIGGIVLCTYVPNNLFAYIFGII